MLLWILVIAALLALLGMRIAASPPFAFLSCMFSVWAERHSRGSELRR